MTQAINVIGLLVFASCLMRMQAAQVDCDNWRSTMDKAGSVVFIAGDREYPPPVTMEQLDQRFCQRHLDAMDVIKNVTRSCLKPFPQQVFGLLTRGSNREVKAVCKNEESRALLLGAFKCFAVGNNWDDFHDSMDDLLIRLETIYRHIENPSLKMAHACCEYHNNIRSVRAKFLPRCSLEKVDFVTNLIKRKLKDPVDLVCAGYYEDDREACRALKRDHPYPRVDASAKPVAKSAIVPLADIFTAAGAERQANQ